MVRFNSAIDSGENTVLFVKFGDRALDLRLAASSGSKCPKSSFS